MAFRLCGLLCISKERKLIHGSGATEEGYKRNPGRCLGKKPSPPRTDSSPRDVFKKLQEGQIGKASNIDIAEAIVQTLLDELNPRGIYLAVQGCEHLNRALVVERELADKKELEIVNVLPSLHAGGAGQLAAFKYFKDPVEVEFITAQAGLDIGDTWWGCTSNTCKFQLPYLAWTRWSPCHSPRQSAKIDRGARALYLDDPIRKS